MVAASRQNKSIPRNRMVMEYRSDDNPELPHPKQPPPHGSGAVVCLISYREASERSYELPDSTIRFDFIIFSMDKDMYKIIEIMVCMWPSYPSLAVELYPTNALHLYLMLSMNPSPE